MITDGPDGVLLDITVIPRAGRTTLAGTRNNSLLIRLAAAPVDGAANQALIAFLSDVLDIPHRAISIQSGDKSRRKRVKIGGLTADALRRRIENASAR